MLTEVLLLLLLPLDSRDEAELGVVPLLAAAATAALNDTEPCETTWEKGECEGGGGGGGGGGVAVRTRGDEAAVNCCLLAVDDGVAGAIADDDEVADAPELVRCRPVEVLAVLLPLTRLLLVELWWAAGWLLLLVVVLR